MPQWAPVMKRTFVSIVQVTKTTDLWIDMAHFLIMQILNTYDLDNFMYYMLAWSAP